MNRNEVLRQHLRATDGERIVVTVEPITQAGIAFDELDGWKVMIHPPQVVIMADALSDLDFALFLQGLTRFLIFALEVLDKGECDDVPDAVLAAQELLSEESPELYAVLDSVFQLS